MKKLKQTRNIGIIAHVDAGKTTVTERILYYTGLIHKIGNVDDGNTTMDKDIQEKKRGITISSAAISTNWKYEDNDCQINIIDTPGHVDFVIEVERSLRILDGVVALFCATSGVEPQTESVWYQAEKYGIPRICFINKMDRQGADFFMVLHEIKNRLNTIPLPLQIPMGSEDDFIGVIDLVKFKAVYWKDDTGDDFIIENIPEYYLEESNIHRLQLLEIVADLDNEFLALYLEKLTDISEYEIIQAIKRITNTRMATPVLCGAAFKNKGVQPLLDAIVRYLPSPDEQELVSGLNISTNEMIELKRSVDASFSALAFKVVSDKFVSKLSMVRIYSGQLAAGDTLLNVRTNEKVRVSRILQMQSDKSITLEKAEAGDIVALVGLKDIKTGDTLTAVNMPFLLESIEIPEPVISIAIEPKLQQDEKSFGMVLSKLTDEDPSLFVEIDAQTGQTILSGMGELHLEVSLEKMKLNYGMEIATGNPKVSYKEIFTETVQHREKFVKQNGGSGQYADITFTIGPNDNGKTGLQFINQIKGGVIPQEFIPFVEKGFVEAMKEGVLAGYPVESMKVVLLDGDTHREDSHALDFEIAARDGFRSTAKKCMPKLLEPIMHVEIMSGDEYTGVITADINKRRGVIQQIEDKGARKIFKAQVPLSNTFGYISDLRTITSGRATISMKLSHYQLLPDFLATNMVSK